MNKFVYKLNFFQFSFFPNARARPETSFRRTKILHEFDLQRCVLRTENRDTASTKTVKSYASTKTVRGAVKTRKIVKNGSDSMNLCRQSVQRRE